MHNVYSLPTFLYFSCMFQCHMHHYQRELLFRLLKIKYCYKAVKYAFYNSCVINTSIIKGTTLLMIGVILVVQ